MAPVLRARLKSGDRRDAARGCACGGGLPLALAATASAGVAVALRGVVGSSPPPPPPPPLPSLASCPPPASGRRPGSVLAPSTSWVSEGANEPSEDRLTSEAVLRLSTSAGAASASPSEGGETRRPAGAGAGGSGGVTGGGKEARWLPPAAAAACSEAAAKLAEEGTLEAAPVPRLVARAGARLRPAGREKRPRGPERAVWECWPCAAQPDSCHPRRPHSPWWQWLVGCCARATWASPVPCLCAGKRRRPAPTGAAARAPAQSCPGTG